MDGRRILIFCETKRGCDAVTRQLRQDGWPALSIHGDKSQQERDWVLAEFKTGKHPIMIATDVAARGLGASRPPARVPTAALPAAGRGPSPGRLGMAGLASLLPAGCTCWRSAGRWGSLLPLPPCHFACLQFGWPCTVRLPCLPPCCACARARFFFGCGRFSAARSPAKGRCQVRGWRAGWRMLAAGGGGGAACGLFGLPAAWDSAPCLRPSEQVQAPRSPRSALSGAEREHGSYEHGSCEHCAAPCERRLLRPMFGRHCPASRCLGSPRP